MSADIRWKQRFLNYEKAFEKLSSAVARGNYDELSQAGLIQMFELTFELGWKTLKDKLEFEGVKTAFPRDTIKTAFQGGYIQNGELWLKALEDRNLLAHTYDKTMSDQARDLIRDAYFPLLQDLYGRLKKAAS